MAHARLAQQVIRGPAVRCLPVPICPGSALAMAKAVAGAVPEHNLAGSVNPKATLAARNGTLAFKAILLLRMVNHAFA